MALALRLQAPFFMQHSLRRLAVHVSDDVSGPVLHLGKYLAEVDSNDAHSCRHDAEAECDQGHHRCKP